MTKLDLTIVIPTYNEERDIRECLKSIAEQKIDKRKVEIIIVDNYSTDKTLEIAKEFEKKINLRIMKNKIKDAEVSKMLGFTRARGELFMYLDADMRFSDPFFLNKMLFPFQDDSRIVGNFIRFKVNMGYPALTRTLSYDEWQRDPVLKFFTAGVNEIVYAKKKEYWLCVCNKIKIPPQGLMIYKKKLIEKIVKNSPQLIDNEVPALFVEKGYKYFAYVPDTGVYHLLVRSLKELWKKRVRNLQRTYFPNKKNRKFRWINWGKDWPKVGIWLLYTHFFIFPILISIKKSIKYRDICFLNEPLLNLVSTYSMIYGVLSEQMKN